MSYPFSILKSPGSKGWFIPYAERFIQEQQANTVIEPFAGSAVVGLTLLDHGHAKRLVLAERDPELHQFWKTALSDADFAQRVQTWTHEFWGARAEERQEFALDSMARMRKTDLALSVLLRSRFGFNGIQREGSMVTMNGSRRSWWPLDLGTRLKLVYDARNKIELFSDAFDVLRYGDRQDSYAFVDPPYSAGKHSPGHKLYRMSHLEHDKLICTLSKWSGSWQLTGEFCPEMLRLVREASFEPPVQQCVVPMRTVQGKQKLELILTRGAKPAVAMFGRERK
jgi:DNA adenine methylase